MRSKIHKRHTKKDHQVRFDVVYRNEEGKEKTKVFETESEARDFSRMVGRATSEKGLNALVKKRAEAAKESATDSAEGEEE